jgi:hypothetical protein
MITTHNHMQSQAPAPSRTRIIRSCARPQADTRTRITASRRIHERTP